MDDINDWLKPGKMTEREQWGKSEALKALPDQIALNKIWEETATTTAKYTPWFSLITPSHRWWHWIIHPFRTYKKKKYIKSVQNLIYKYLDTPDVKWFHLDEDE